MVPWLLPALFCFPLQVCESSCVFSLFVTPNPDLFHLSPPLFLFFWGAKKKKLCRRIIWLIAQSCRQTCGTAAPSSLHLCSQQVALLPAGWKTGSARPGLVRSGLWNRTRGKLTRYSEV